MSRTLALITKLSSTVSLSNFKDWMKHACLVICSCLVMSTCFLLQSCAQKTPAPVYDLNKSSKSKYSQKKKFNKKKTSHRSKKLSKYQRNTSIRGELPERYVVKSGDTLFSIAWHYALDYKQLARLNGLSKDVIYPGQSLKLQQANDEKIFDSRSLLIALNQKVLKHPVAISGNTVNENSIISRPLIKKNLREKNQLAKKNQFASSKSSSEGATQQKAIYRTKKNHNANKVSKSKRGHSIHWIWPSDGSILRLFSSKLNANRGLDIAGKKGQPVRASASGQVVYKGNGLRGYGNLLIIKHNEDYLSAYAHNNKIYVSENEYVKVGQRIADIGSSGTQKDKLHFEIRYRGKPVDPLNYLPRK